MKHNQSQKRSSVETANQEGNKKIKSTGSTMTTADEVSISFQKNVSILSQQLESLGMEHSRGCLAFVCCCPYMDGELSLFEREKKLSPFFLPFFIV